MRLLVKQKVTKPKYICVENQRIKVYATDIPGNCSGTNSVKKGGPRWQSMMSLSLGLGTVG